MGLFNLFKASKTVVVVDGVALNEALGMKGSIPPRNQLQVLRRLARFAQREKVEMVVALSGSPLIKAPAGKKFEDVMVVYSKSPEAHAKYLVKTARAKGTGAVLVSGNTPAEKMALASGVKTMRISTFRKAFDIGANDIEGDAPERNGNERGGNERGGNDRNRRRPQRRPQRQSEDKGQERPPKEMSEADAINELIDLVD